MGKEKGSMGADMIAMKVEDREQTTGRIKGDDMNSRAMTWLCPMVDLLIYRETSLKE